MCQPLCVNCNGKHSGIDNWFCKMNLNSEQTKRIARFLELTKIINDNRLEICNEHIVKTLKYVTS